MINCTASLNPAVCLPMTLLALVLPLSSAQAYSVYIDGSALSTSDWYHSPPTHSYATGETDGATRLSDSTGVITGDRYSQYVSGASPNTAYAASGVDMATGTLNARVWSTMNSGDASNIPATARSFAEFRDSVSFDLPGEMTSATVDFTLAMDGMISSNADALVGPSGCNNTNGSDIGGYLSLSGAVAQTSSIHPCGLLWAADENTTIGLPYDLTLTTTIVEGAEYTLLSRFWLALSNNLQGETVEFDFSGTAGLSINNLPEGTIMTSDSNVLLTQTPSAVPLPPAVVLLGSGMLAMLFAARGKRMAD